ncbi:helix-turn-helix domain-containing protein [Actinacidiphila sp. ITFR-21]|uniref:helix-turn-helix domain-containing protein n=1 Tax=Actinacidiphila sp. ITFR-21 TaxID=3075199 RepID=UPI00288AD795|nr:helix-turn-helix transcriptional regulator [Streptomyces sp. ITFR-21]WNI19956.1 helix-turn-helix transcriptional regulator [Streptomyces sp. ITFR-21]
MSQKPAVEPPKAGIGRNIAAIRKQRDLTQHGLAQRANISYSLLTKIESGRVAATPKATAACARALRVPVTDLTGQPYVRSLKDEGLEELIQPLRASISNPMLPSYEDDVPPRPLNRVLADLRSLEASRLRGEYMPLGVGVPALIDELIEIVHDAPSARRREEAFTHLAQAYRLGNCFAHKLGFLDLSLISLDRMQSAAAQSSDPYLQAVVTHYRSDYFLHHGAYDVGLRGIRAMERLLEEPARRGDTRALSALGTMHLKAAVLHSRQRRPSARGDAFARITEAHEIAQRAEGNPDPYGLIFDRWNVAIHETSIRIDIGEHGEAVEKGESIRFPESWAQNRRSHHHMDMARLYEKEGRPDEAFSALVNARSLASDQTRYHPTTRETVLALLRKRGQPSKQLQSYARWIGV